MTRFLINLSVFGLLFIGFAELFLRVTGLASDVMDRVLSEDKILIFQPGANGYRTGGMRAEINAYYHINKQGWNSSYDYDQVDSQTVAIIGDSYIASFSNDVDSNVAAILQSFIRQDYPSIEVHSYGHPGANFSDYENLVPILAQKGYQHFYVYINPKDFSAKKPSFTGKNKHRGRTGIRYWYRKSALLRYLNVNLGIQNMIGPKNGNKEQNQEKLNKGYQKAIDRLKAFDMPAINFFYEDSFFDTLQIANDLIKIEHTRQPVDHGFNGHWNVNGNKNAAESIYHHWNKNYAPSKFCK
jgi:hypothetical protein